MPNLFLGFPVSRAKIAEMIEGSAPPIAHAPWHLPDGQDPLILPADITAGQAVGWDGSKYKGYAAGGAGGPDLLTNFFYQTFFESLDAFYQYVRYTGAITLYNYAVYLSTGAQINSRARLYKQCSVPTPGLTWAKKRELVVRASLTNLQRDASAADYGPDSTIINTDSASWLRAIMSWVNAREEPRPHRLF